MTVWHSHTGIVVEEMQKALPFWTNVLGFRLVRSVEVVPDPDRPTGGPLEGLHARVEWVRHGDFQIELIDWVNRKDTKVEMGPMDVHATHQGLYARDFMKHYDRIMAQGGWFLAAPDETASTLHGKDWDGNWVQLVRYSIADQIPRGQLRLDESGFGHAHSAVVVKDIQDAVSFYRDLLGMEEVKWQIMEPSDRFKGTRLEGVRLQEAWLRLGGFMIELIEYGNKQDVVLDMDVRDVHATHIAFFCDSVQEEHRRLEAEGIWFLDEPYDAQGNPRRWAYGKDPDGNWFELIGLPPDGRGSLPKP